MVLNVLLKNEPRIYATPVVKGLNRTSITVVHRGIININCIFVITKLGKETSSFEVKAVLMWLLTFLYYLF